MAPSISILPGERERRERERRERGREREEREREGEVGERERRETKYLPAGNTSGILGGPQEGSVAMAPSRSILPGEKEMERKGEREGEERERERGETGERGERERRERGREKERERWVEKEGERPNTYQLGIHQTYWVVHKKDQLPWHPQDLYYQER